MPEPDWEDARHFTALAETLNLARAAAELRTSQVTVMRRVKALERALDVTLFVRRRDGHRLTPAGADLLRSTREAAQLMREGAGRVSGRDRSATGRVRIVTTELAANWILLPRVPAFLTAHPDIKLEIDASPDAVALEDVDTLALRFRRPERGKVRMRKLGEMSFSLYGVAALITASAGEPAPYVGWGGSFAEIGLSRWLRRVHADAPPAFALTTFDGHLKAVRQGIATSALPDFIAAGDPTLERLPTPEPSFRLEAWLVIPEQMAQLARSRRVARFVQTAFAEAVSRTGR